MLEEDICGVAEQQLVAAGFTGRGEVICRTALQGDVPADWAGYNADEHTVVIEAKPNLTPKLIRQLLRWLDLSNQVVGYIRAPARITQVHEQRVAILGNAGVGLRCVHSDGGVDIPLPGRFNGAANTKRLLAAIRAAPADIGPPAGVAAAKRCTPSRNKWTPATLYIRKHKGCTATDIKRYADLGFNPTAAAMRKAIDGGEWLGVRYEGHSITKFFRVRKSRSEASGRPRG